MKPISTLILVIALLAFTGSYPADAQNIGALGRIFPAKGIVMLAGPVGDTIETLHVASEDPVSQGTLLVTFGSLKKRQMEVVRAENQLDWANRQTQKAIDIQNRQIQIIRNQSDHLILLQKKNILSVQEQYEFAQKSLDRLLSVGPQSYSLQTMEVKKHNLQMAAIHLETAKSKLENLKTSKSLDLETAELELSRLKLDRDIRLEQASNDLKKARNNLALSTLASPSDGVIIEVMQKKGENCTSGPIMQLADLSAMIVIAEVFQADLLKIKPGMKAKITSKSLPETLTGKVHTIGRIILDPSKIAKVGILLDDPVTAARLINLEVEVSILME
jgi:HlyD family secretion protein